MLLGTVESSPFATKHHRVSEVNARGANILRVVVGPVWEAIKMSPAESTPKVHYGVIMP